MNRSRSNRSSIFNQYGKPILGGGLLTLGGLTLFPLTFATVVNSLAVGMLASTIINPELTQNVVEYSFAAMVGIPLIIASEIERRKRIKQ